MAIMQYNIFSVQKDMKRALDELYASETYKKLSDPECGLYYQGAVYVFSFLKNEIENGIIK